jgi:hypothetical protein
VTSGALSCGIVRDFRHLASFRRARWTSKLSKSDSCDRAVTVYDHHSEDHGRFVDDVSGEVGEGDLGGLRCVVLVRQLHPSKDDTRSDITRSLSTSKRRREV